MMRQMKTERNPLQRAEGSARWEQGTREPRPIPAPNRPAPFSQTHHRRLVPPSLPPSLPPALTRDVHPALDAFADRSVVLAAVYGPTQVQARKEDVDKLAIEVCWRPAFGLQTPADVDAERTLRRTLEQIVLTAKYPRLGLRVVVQVISADGAVEACAMNATCHALMDAGVEMFGTLVAATVAIPKIIAGDAEELGPCADPTEDEERDAAAVGTFAYCFRGGKPGEVPANATPERECDVVHCSARGEQMSEDDFLRMATLARDACVEVYVFMRAAVCEWEEDVEREQARLEERCKAVAAAVKEHGVDGAVEIFRLPYGPKGTGAGGNWPGAGEGAKRKAQDEPAPMETAT